MVQGVEKLYGFGDPLLNRTGQRIAIIGATTLTLTGNLLGPLIGQGAEELRPNDTITVTVDKDWIRDVNGVQMEADYVFTFTTP